ncbi:unnamed protein product [Rotaria magnacalcarata]|uniref:Uncharacterized protein n=1 Tax=Rotaria magnacalcarata TaxID=392030 RepID=A0A816SZP9_9BILA|nr:unnamed protein product [Rotaria magnacalcarata]CAF4010397.1 unnamed protein product [Rotaria magnacalcarata]
MFAASTSIPTNMPLRPLILITRPNDTIVGLYKTIAGRSTGGSNGTYPNNEETPLQAIDGLLSTKYVNLGRYNSPGFYESVIGIGTGFYVVPKISNSSVAIALRFATSDHSPSNDPTEVTLEGTNEIETKGLNLGSNWRLIYRGTSGMGLTSFDVRSTYMPPVHFQNTIAYRSYRLLVSKVKMPNSNNAVQYAEAQILGYI